MDLPLRRRFYAEEITAVANLQTPALIEALAELPRERFLLSGPWHVMGQADVLGHARLTSDADARHVYHNYAIAIDPSRQLFNGSPALIVGMIDRLQLEPGARVLHVGTGLGYYTSLVGHAIVHRDISMHSKWTTHSPRTRGTISRRCPGSKSAAAAPRT